MRSYIAKHGSDGKSGDRAAARRDLRARKRKRILGAEHEAHTMRELSDIAPGVLVATSRTMHTNTAVLATGGHARLVDPSWHPDELEGLADAIAAREPTVTGGFATHAHHDHLLWLPAFGEVPRWASPKTAELAGSERHRLVEALGQDFPTELVALMGRVTGIEQLPTEFLGPDHDVELVFHDGHAPGHTALWLPYQRVLISGDMLSDIELPLPFSPDDLPADVAALETLTPFAERADLLIPGHGTVGTDALARLDADRRYIDDALTSGSSSDARISKPGMAEEYAHLQSLARGG